MLLPLLVFVVVVGAVLGGYYAVTELPKMAAARRLESRLHDIVVDTAAAADGARKDDTVLKRSAEGPLPAMDRALAGTRAGSRLARLI